MGKGDDAEPGEYASPACFLHELDPAFAGLTPPPEAGPDHRERGATGPAGEASATTGSPSGGGQDSSDGQGRAGAPISPRHPPETGGTNS